MTDDLVKRLRDAAKSGYDIYGLHCDIELEAADRLEQLESSSEGWKEIADEYFDAICERNARIEKLEAQLAQSQLKRWAARWEEQADRIEKLEAALRALKALHHDGGIDDLTERDDRTYFMVCEALDAE